MLSWKNHLHAYCLDHFLYPPRYLISKILLAKHNVHQQFQVMAHCRVAMQINAARIFQHSVQLHEPYSHIRQITIVVTRPTLYQLHALKKSVQLLVVLPNGLYPLVFHSPPCKKCP